MLQRGRVATNGVAALIRSQRAKSGIRQNGQLTAPHTAVLWKSMEQQHGIARIGPGDINGETKLSNVPGLRLRFHHIIASRVSGQGKPARR
jgi:hypothetical protein